MGDCSLDPKFGGGMVLGQCREDQASQAIVYAEVGPGNEKAWNADPAVNDSGLPYPPALPAHHEFNANAQPAPARQGIVYENVGPGNEAAWNADPAINDSGLPYPPALPVHHEFNANAKPAPARQEMAQAREQPSMQEPAGFMSELSNLALPILGGYSVYGLAVTAMGSVPAFVAPLAVPGCATPVGGPICLGAFMLGGAGGAVLALKGDGLPLSKLSLPRLASGSVAALTGGAQGWSRAAQGFVHSGIYLSATAFVVGRAGAFSAELARTHDPLKAAKNTATDWIGMSLDLSAGSFGHQAGAALSNKRVRDAASPLLRELASKEGKEAANALIRFTALRSVIAEGRLLLGEKGRDFIEFLGGFNRDNEQAVLAMFKGSGAELRQLASKIVGWAIEAQGKLRDIPFDWNSSVGQIVKYVRRGLEQIEAAGNGVLRQQALSTAMGREIPLSMRVEVPVRIDDLITGLNNFGKLLAAPEARALPAWNRALALARFELGQGFEPVVRGKVSLLEGDLFRLGRSHEMSPQEFVHEVNELRNLVHDNTDLVTQSTRDQLMKLVDEAEKIAARSLLH